MRCLTAGLLLSAAALPVSADELPFIVVEGARINSAADIDPAEATGPVRIINRDHFANRTVTLADALGDQTGVQIRQSGGLGSYSALSLRGSTSRQVQVVVDGMLLNDPVTGGVDISQLTLNDIRRVQVYPGNAPAQFAHAGIGGVVIMETLGRDTEAQTRLNLGLGANGTDKAGVFNSDSHDDVYYWVSLNRQSSDNDFRYPNERDWFNPNDGRETTRRNADYEQTDASTKLGWAISDTSALDALIQWSDHDKGVPTIQNWRNNHAHLSGHTVRTQLHYRQQGWANGRLHTSHRLIWSDASDRYDNRDGLVGLGTADVRTDSQRLGLVNTASLLLGSHTVSATVDISQFDYDQDDRLDTDRADERERRQLTTALGHQWQSDDHRWRTQASLRRFDVDDTSDESQGDGSTERVSSHDAYHSWQLGLSRYLGDSWVVSANLSRQVRVPTLQERYGQEGLFVGNPDLAAEESSNAELSVRTDRGWGHIEVTGYRRELDPAVAAIYDARGVGRYVNLSADVMGVEVDAAWQLTPDWRLAANATVQDSENTSASVRDRHNKQLPGVYHQSLLVSSRWQLRPFEVDLSYQYDDDLYYDAANLLAADARQLVNAGVSWRHTWHNRQQTDVRLEVRNLTDELYQDFNRFPGQGRSWFLNLTHTL